MGVCWISNTTLVTVSSDKTMKFWDNQLENLKSVPITNSTEQMKQLDTFIVGVSYCQQT